LEEKKEWCENPAQQLLYVEDGSVMQEFAADTTIKHVAICSDFLANYTYESYVKMEDISIWAVNYNKTVNWFYLARNDTEMFRERIQNALANPTEDTLYIFTATDEELCKQYGFYYAVIDDYIVARTVPIEAETGIEE
jgi:hypothetical protein